jgi:quercetin dioxygenase-like cupin family protein
MNVYKVLFSSALTGCIVSSLLFHRVVEAQSGGAVAQIVWENERMQVRRISIEPGARLAGDSAGGSVMVFLTADLDGRMPPAEVAWRDPGPAMMENRGRTRFEALVVDLKGGAAPSSRVTPPEVVRASANVAPRAYSGSYDSTMRAQNLIVNERVNVTKERYGSAGSVDPQHFHPQDAVVIYLRSGYVWPVVTFYGPDRVRRGDVRVVPGNTFHVTGNAGSDPLEFLLIIPA